MKGFCDQFYGILETNSLTIDNLANKKNGISSYFNKLGNGELRDEKVCNQTLEKCLNSSGSWVTKNAENRDYIISLVESELRPLLIDAEKMRPIQKTTINSCKLTLKYINNLRLLANIDLEVRELNQRNNRFLLSDTNALLHGLISKGDATFVYEKIGTNIDTVMIEECLSQKEGSLIVGDIKQSIYRWRNGDWKILANIKHDPTLRVNECTLDTNWRSESMIIRFNNEFFTAACLELNNRYEEEMKEPCAPLVNAYIDVCQKTAKHTENGYVKVSMLTDSKDNPFREQVLNELVDEVKSLIEQGVQTNDIAILVRKNKDIPQIAEFFDKNAGVRIVSDEAFQLNASLAICMMIDGLRYLTTPEDTVAKARLALSYQKEILRQDIDMNTILLNGTDQYLPADFLLRQKELRFMPLYELLEKLFVIFSMNQIKQQDAYLCAFYDAITEYMQKNSSELTAFIAFWDEHLSTKTIPSGEIDGIRILSIHKSKGLEFHTVLIPYCDWKMENETNSNLIWSTPNQITDNAENASLFNALDIVPINYSKTMAESVYSNSYYDERLQLWIDNINLLYVAFTRACKNLIVWGCSNKKGTVSELLEQSISQVDIEQTKFEEEDYETEETNDEATRYEFGKLYISEAKKYESSAAAISRESAKMLFQFVDKAKILNYILRFMQRKGLRQASKNGLESTFTLGSITSWGVHTCFETVAEKCSDVYSIGDCTRNIASLLINGFSSAFRQCGKDTEKFTCSLCPEFSEHLCIPELSLAFVCENDYHPYRYSDSGEISQARFLKRNIPHCLTEKLACNEELKDELISSAVFSLYDAMERDNELCRYLQAFENAEKYEVLNKKIENLCFE